MEPCEIVEAQGVFTSSTPATDIILVLPTSGVFSSTPFTGVAPPVLVTNGTLSSLMIDDWAAVLISNGVLASVVTPNTDVNHPLLTGKATAKSRLFAAFHELSVDTGVLTSSLPYAEALQLLVSTAEFTTSIPALNADRNLTLESSGLLTSAIAELGLVETAIVSGVLASTVTPLRTAFAQLDASGAFTSAIFGSNEVNLLLTNQLTGQTALIVQTDHQALLASTGELRALSIFRNPGRVAWVTNTETASSVWYDNFDFESIAQTPDKVLAVGADGLYELTGETDAGDAITAYLKTGFTDFAIATVKRVENLYFGYTSSGQLAVTLEVLDSNQGAQAYNLEARTATAPRTSRVVPGKGMWGRYWRIKIANVAGVDFIVHSTTVDLATSKRRI